MSKRLGALSSQMVDKALNDGWVQVAQATSWDYADVVRNRTQAELPHAGVRIDYWDAKYHVMVKEK